MTDPVPGLEPGGPLITLSVKVFAGLREQAGWAERLVTMAAGPAATPQRLWQILRIGQDGAEQGASWAGAPLQRALPTSLGWAPALAEGPLPRSVRVAVNQRFAEGDQPLEDGDEVAYLPAISGG